MTAPPAPTGAPRRTGGLWTLAIGLLLLGLVGCACDVLGVMGTVMQRSLMSDIPTTGDTMVDNMGSFLPLTFALQIGGMLFSTIVLGCAILILLWHTLTPRLVPAMLFATCAFVVLSTGLSVWMQHSMMSGMGLGGAGDDFVGMSLAMSLCFAGGWALIKIAFFVWGATYLRKPEIAMLFGGQTPHMGPRGD